MKPKSLRPLDAPCVSLPLQLGTHRTVESLFPHERFFLTTCGLCHPAVHAPYRLPRFGKTTLLNRLPSDARFRNSLVIINELADLALDGTRLTDVDMEHVVLNSGCVCCTTSADLTNTVAKTLFRREHNLLPKFDRFVLETTGAADPYPLISSFGSRGNLSHLCHLEAVIATIDAHSTLRATRPTP